MAAAIELLPDLVLDRILSFLEDEDLRSCHQVCHAWKEALEKRQSVNQRRLDLVQNIHRDNKENLKKKPKVDPNANEVSRVNWAAGVKPGSTTLKDCQNLLVPATVLTSTPKADSIKLDFLTPITPFPFQIMQEALSPGQKIYQCVKCKSNMDDFRNFQSPSISILMSPCNINDDLALLSFESSSLSASSVSCPNLSDSFVLECPNKNCSFRFCGTCLTSEHEGRPCRIIDSDSFETTTDDSETASFPGSLRNLSTRSKKDGEGKRERGRAKGNRSKASKLSLRRIARL